MFDFRPSVDFVPGLLASLEVRPTLLGQIGEAQRDDPQLVVLVEKLIRGESSSHLGRYTIDDKGWLHRDGRLCVPQDEGLKKAILDDAHRSRMTIHPGGDKMYQDMKRVFFWAGMKKDVAEYVARCLVCQQVKVEQRKPGGLLHPLEVPQWKWDSVSMDFIDGLPRSRKGNTGIWVVVDRLTKSAHFIPVKSKRTAPWLASVYVREIVRLHGVPSSIVSDRDPIFTSEFWRSLQEAVGTQLCLSTAYHPQTDGQTERVNRILEDLLRLCILDFGGTWEEHLPLVEFAYNNSFQSSIGMAPFEALYGRPCRSPTCWWESTDKILLGPDMVRETSEKIDLIRKRMKAAQDRQKSYADRRRTDLEFEVGDMVFVKVSPLRNVVRFGSVGKLAPRFVGPFPIKERIGRMAYRVELPDRLSGVHDVFHVSHLRKCLHETAEVVEPSLLRDVEVERDATIRRAPTRILGSETRKLRNREVQLVKVQWGDDESNATWETEAKMRSLYPFLFESMSFNFSFIACLVLILSLVYPLANTYDL